jgi:gluconate kinase
MNPSVIESQFAILEEPSQAIVVEAARSPGDIVASIRKSLSV